MIDIAVDPRIFAEPPAAIARRNAVIPPGSREIDVDLLLPADKPKSTKKSVSYPVPTYQHLAKQLKKFTPKEPSAKKMDASSDEDDFDESSEDESLDADDLSGFYEIDDILAEHVQKICKRRWFCVKWKGDDEHAKTKSGALGEPGNVSPGPKPQRKRKSPCSDEDDWSPVWVPEWAVSAGALKSWRQLHPEDECEQKKKKPAGGLERYDALTAPDTDFSVYSYVEAYTALHRQFPDYFCQPRLENTDKRQKTPPIPAAVRLWAALFGRCVKYSNMLSRRAILRVEPRLNAAPRIIWTSNGEREFLKTVSISLSLSLSLAVCVSVGGLGGGGGGGCFCC